MTPREGIKMSQVKPDVIYLSSCMANAKPACPYASAEEMATIIGDKTGVPVVLGTHEYH
jgi:predicted metal-binding protein